MPEPQQYGHYLELPAGHPLLTDRTALEAHLKRELRDHAHANGWEHDPDAEWSFVIHTQADGLVPALAENTVAVEARTRVVPDGTTARHAIGSADGPPGPFSASQYGQPHVYARAIHSGTGNCLCGSALGDRIHTEAAPGVPIPEEMRW